MCDHEYHFQNVVYHYSEYPRPGSGAYDRIYEDAYFCSRCLDVVYKNSRVLGNSYSKAIEGTVPK